MVKAARHIKIVKKRTKRFIRHQSDRYKKLKVSATSGITNCFSYYNSVCLVPGSSNVRDPVCFVMCVAQYDKMHVCEYYLRPGLFSVTGEDWRINPRSACIKIS